MSFKLKIVEGAFSSEFLTGFFMVNILIVDDKKSMRDMLTIVLQEKGYCTFSLSSGQEALELLSKQAIDILITDMKMPYIGGLDLLEKLSDISPQTSSIVITAYGTVQNAVKAIKLGAFDFIEKPFSIENLEKKIEQLIEKKQQKFQVEKETKIVGVSDTIKNLRSLIAKVAVTSTSVLITGESGTGKELVAEEIHNNSLRQDFPFVAINCGALVDSLLESELFGHEKGAYTGAQEQKKGRFEIAHQGSLFLDEIAEMNYNLQAKLLRVLQNQVFERVGGTKQISVDVRIITATNKDLASFVKKEKFRKDLYYRLNVINIHIPPLRERKEDISILCQYYLEKYAKRFNKEIHFAPEVLGYLRAYSWPGNIRELKNTIERGLILAEGDTFNTRDLNPEILEELNISKEQKKKKINITQQLELIEKESIRQVLEKNNGNQTQASKELGIGRTALQYKMKKYGL